MKNQEQATILLVEDDLVTTMVEVDLLKSFGYDVVTAISGEEAVQIAIGNDKISLILMDVNLGSGMDGTEAAKQILGKRNLPIMFLSSHTDKEYVERIKGIAGYGYVVKNSSNVVLQTSIEMALNLFKAQEEIRQAKEDWNRTFNSVPDLITLIDEKHTITRVNRAMADLLGVKPEDAIGRKCYACIHNTDQPPDFCPHVQLLNDGKEHEAEIKEENLGKWLHVTVSPLRNDAGDIIGAVHVARDITKRKKAEEALRLFKDSVEHSSDAIGMSTPDGRHYYQNEAFNCLFGDVGDCPPETLYVDQAIGKQVFDSILGGRSWQGEVQMFKKDRTILDILLRAYAIQNQDGRIIGLVGLHTDITERKRAEDEILFKNMLLEAQSETSIDGILAVDNEGHSILFNKRFGEIWKIPQDVQDTKDDKKMLEYILKQLKDPAEFIRKVAYLYEHKDEKSRDEIEFADGRCLDRYSSPLISADGKYHGRIWYFRDITMRKRAEEALRESERSLAITFSSIGDAVIATDAQCRIVRMNRVAEQLTGWLLKEALGRPLNEVFHIINQHTRLPLENPVAKVLETGQVQGLANDTVLVSRQGVEFIIADSAAAIMDDQTGKAIGVVLVFRDQTREHAAAEALRESQQTFKDLVETTDTGYVVIDTEGKVLDANSEYVRLAGHRDLNEIRGRSVVEWTADYEKAKNAKAVAECKQTGLMRNLEIDYVNSRGEITPVEINATVVEKDGLPTILTLCRDITERKRAEKALKESEAKYKTLFTGAAEGMLVTDLKAKQFRYANPAMCRMLGYTEEEFMRLSVADIHPKESLEHVLFEFEALIQDKKVLTTDIPCLRKDGTLFYANISFVKMVLDGRECAVGLFTDITEQKLMQEKLLVSEKLAAMGRLVADVAHEINNPLSIIMSGTQILEERTKKQTPAMPDLKANARMFEKVKNATRRCRTIVAGLLTSTRPTVLNLGSTDINKVIKESLKSMDDQFKRQNVKVIKDLAFRLPMTEADGQRLNQVFINIITNACDAMPEGGELRIATRLQTLEASKQRGEESPAVEIEISDTGKGIRKEDLSKIFNPFFTTKQDGKGVGLGLSISYGIVKEHGGSISATSEKGKGATFMVRLPCRT